MGTEQPLLDELAGVFARMSGLLLSGETAGSVLRLVTTLAQETIPGSAGSGLSILDPAGKRTTTAATGDLVERADRIQYENGAGPCLTAWADRTTVRVDDLNQDRRWPDWSRRAYALGLRASLSAPLVAGDSALGAMKVYASRTGAYGSREESLLRMFATQAAVLVANVKSFEDARRVSSRLQASLRGRDLVNVAKGIVMARDHVDEHTAFLHLANTARQRRKELLETAEDLAKATRRPRR
ncbi:GAF and ANTAR domain-containing protein [Amycolatopsis sp. NPDC051061]|uniref:GAF and ANTAR domain-containing protein n=1 Tax=Amycolatopsis sp. NPDC051061 TaxID=3155042 RepID=UPI0034371E0B